MDDPTLITGDHRVAAPIMNTVLRSILSADVEMPADLVLKKARARGVTQPDATIRHNIYNLRSDIRRKSREATPAVAQAAAKRQTVAPKPVTPSQPTTVTKATTPAPTSTAVDLNSVFANISLVNEAVALCGGVDQARRVADAVRKCGSLEAFLKHLDLVAGLRASVTTTA